MPHEVPARDPFFFAGLFLSGLDYGLVSLRWVGIRLVWLFSVPVYSPRDKRGKWRVWNPQAWIRDRG